MAICRALVHDPAILLLDGATSALDNASEQIVFQALKVTQEGHASFTIAHRPRTVQESDLILVCAEGRVIEQGHDRHLMLHAGCYASLQMIAGKIMQLCACKR